MTGRSNSTNHIRLRPAAVTALIAINAFWGLSSASAKTALGYVGPFTLTLCRFLPAGIILLVLARKQIPLLAMGAKDFAKLMLLASVGITLTYTLYFTGLGRTNSTDASLLFACEPILLSVAATFFLSEKLNMIQWLGLLIGVFGIWIIAGRAEGNWLALLGLACECCTGVIAKELVSRYPPLALLGAEMIIGALVSVPGALAECSASTHLVLTPLALLNIVYLSLICSALCYGVWYKLMNSTPLSQMSAFILVQPLLGPFYGHFLHGDIVTITVVEGAVFVMLGILLTQVNALRRDERTPELVEQNNK